MRRAFTLIELLAVVAIIATMVAVGMVSLAGGRQAAQVKAAARDVYAAIKNARSRAIVTGNRVVCDFGNRTVDGENAFVIELTSSLVMNTASGKAKPKPYFVTTWKELSETSPSVVAGGTSEGEGGESIEEILFSPMSAEVVKGMCLRFQKGDKTDAGLTEAQRQSSISTFSTADYWIKKYNDAKAATTNSTAVAAKTEEETSEKADTSGLDESGQVVWETNGSVDPHKVWIYPDGGKPDEGLLISVDRYGAIKIRRGDGSDEED